MWYHTYVMRKTTVYLSDEEAAALRRMSVQTGRSQADLLREGVRRVVEEALPRVFHSMGTGRSGGGEWPARWNSDELYQKVMGRKP